MRVRFGSGTHSIGDNTVDKWNIVICEDCGKSVSQEHVEYIDEMDEGTATVCGDCFDEAYPPQPMHR